LNASHFNAINLFADTVVPDKQPNLSHVLIVEKLVIPPTVATRQQRNVTMQIMQTLQLDKQASFAAQFAALNAVAIIL
jgi:hypothetical protein